MLRLFGAEEKPRGRERETGEGLYGGQPREYPSSFCELIARPSASATSQPAPPLPASPLAAPSPRHDLSINLLSSLCAAPRIPTIVIRPYYVARRRRLPRGRSSYPRPATLPGIGVFRQEIRLCLEFTLGTPAGYLSARLRYCAGEFFFIHTCRQRVGWTMILNWSGVSRAFCITGGLINRRCDRFESPRWLVESRNSRSFVYSMGPGR